jgi:predicted ribosome quality control (RQC) complex YloA/Tae2 family protein
LLLPEEIEDIRIRGELILANIGKIRKGAAQAKIFNPYKQTDMQISLDPRLSPQANAQRYFSKYKKEKRGQPKLREQIKTLSKELDDTLVKPYIAPKEEKKERSKTFLKEPFHKFLLDSGSVIFVGKNAQSNDELTFKYARPNDYFFHTRGFEGAHTLLRANVPKGQRPRREEIEMAASIAAYFSKAKKQHNVPVSYTQRKYLRKNKKGKRGSVVLMREEVIFVEPGLPDL